MVVGAGPTGLMLACELALGGAKARLLEERIDMPNITRAFAVHARTLELLDARGLADELLTRGVPVYEIAPPGGATMDLRELPTRFGMVLIVPQSGTEQVLAARADELGVEIVRGAEVVGLTQDDDGVTIECAGGDTVRAGYVVGCDGAHSTVRRLVGIDFVGKQYETHILLADVRLAAAPSDTLTGVTNEKGVVLVIPFGDGWFRAIAWDRLREQAPLKEPVTRRGDPRLVRPHRGPGLRHDRDAVELTVSVRAQAGQALPHRTGVHRGRRRPCALPARRAGHEHRHRRRDEPGLEAGRRRRADPRRRGCWTATRTSAIRSAPACCG